MKTDETQSSGSSPTVLQRWLVQLCPSAGPNRPVDDDRHPPARNIPLLVYLVMGSKRVVLDATRAGRGSPPPVGLTAPYDLGSGFLLPGSVSEPQQRVLYRP